MPLTDDLTEDLYHDDGEAWPFEHDGDRYEPAVEAEDDEP